MAKVFSAVLPSGRSVKVTKLNVSTFFGASERAASKMGAKAGGPLGLTTQVQGTKLSLVEMIASCMTHITPLPIPWQYVPFRDEAGQPMRDENGAVQYTDLIDVDAMLDAAETATMTKDHQPTREQLIAGGGGYRPVSPLELQGDGEMSIKALFEDDLQDFMAINHLIQEVTFPLGRTQAMALSKRRMLVKE